MNSLLVRNMDLIHSRTSEGVHVLKFDTSYPVKVSGYIIKTFKATDDYKAGDSFKLILDETQSVVIPEEKIYGFREQFSKEDYFKKDDCVMAIIEANSSSLGGSIRICNLSPVSNTANEGIYITYKCNGINDTEKLQEIINLIYNATDSIEVNNVPVTISNRDITIEIVGRIGLGKPTVFESDVDRERRIAYINVCPTNKDPYFNIRLNFAKAAFRDNPYGDIVLYANPEDTEKGIPGYRAFLFNIANTASHPKLFVDSLRFENYLLSYLFCENEYLDTSNYTSIRTAYIETNDMKYTDSSRMRYDLEYPMPCIADNYSSVAKIVFNDLSVMDITNSREHLIINSGECEINNINVHYGTPDSSNYLWGHIVSTMDSLFVNAPKTFNSNNGKLFVNGDYNIDELNVRHVITDTTADYGQDFGYIFDTISLADIPQGTTPTLTFRNSVFNCNVHNVILNIGGDVTVKNSEIDYKGYKNCNENSIIMSYGGSVNISVNEINIDSDEWGISSIYLFPIRNSLETGAQYTAPNLKSNSNRFMVKKGLNTMFKKITIPDGNTNVAAEDLMLDVVKATCYIYNIHSYMSGDINRSNRYNSVSLITITDCDYSCTYTSTISSPISKYSNTQDQLIGSLYETGYIVGVLYGVVILYSRGNPIIKIQNCTTGMNGLSDGSIFSNCPTMGIICVSTLTGTLSISDSDIKTCTSTVVNITNRQEDILRLMTQNLLNNPELLNSYPLEVFDLDNNGVINTADLFVSGIIQATQYSLDMNIDNSVIANGFEFAGADNDSEFIKAVSPKNQESIRNTIKNNISVFPGVYTVKNRKCRLTNTRFECSDVILNPVANDSDIVINNCDFNSCTLLGYEIQNSLVKKTGGSNSEYTWVSFCGGKNLNQVDFSSDTKLKIDSCRFHPQHHPIPRIFAQISISTVTNSYRAIEIGENSMGSSNRAVPVRDKLRLKYPDSFAYNIKAHSNDSYYDEGDKTSLSMYNIPNVTIDGCDFESIYRAVDYVWTFSANHDNVKSATAKKITSGENQGDYEYESMITTRGRFVMRNNFVRSVMDKSSGMNGTITVNGRGVDSEFYANTFLSAAKRCMSCILIRTTSIEFCDSYDIEDLSPNSIIAHDNVFNNITYGLSADMDMDIYTKNYNREYDSPYDYVSPGDTSVPNADDMIACEALSCGINMYGPNISVDIRNNKFLKTRGTPGKITSDSTYYYMDEDDITKIECKDHNTITNVLLPEIKANTGLMSGRSMNFGLLGPGSGSCYSYKFWNTAVIRGTIKDNLMGAMSGDMLINITTRGVYHITEGFRNDEDDDVFENTESDIVVNSPTTETKRCGFDVDLKCSGNYIQPLLPSINQLSNGYRFDPTKKRFYK